MIKISFKNPFIIVVFSLIVGVMSWVVIPRMPVDILPQYEKSAMQIITLYPGMPAKVVEKDITSRMERWTGQSNGIVKQTSKSIMGVSLVTDYFGEDVHPATAMANASSYAMSDMYYQPPGTLPPMVQPFDPTASKPLMLLTASSETMSGKELYDVAYYALRNMLGGVEGIIAPAAYGGELRRIYIYADPQKLEARDLSQTDVLEAVKENTTMIPSGVANIGNMNYGVEAKGMIQDVEDFNDIIIKYENGNPVYVRDIGEAKDAGAIQTNIVRVDGKRQVYLPIFKRRGANTIASVNEVRSTLPELETRLPEGVDLNVIFDQSSYVQRTIQGITSAGISGLILVILVLILFLGNIRSAAIVALSIPLSVLFAFLGLYFSGEAINSITLGGIALVLGLLVDNSIVVLENIDRQQRLGKNLNQAAYDAATEVMMPVLVSSVVIAVVFFPIFFLTGMAQYLFSPLALTVAFAMAGSYIFSLTLIPVAAAKFFPDRVPKAEGTEKRGFFSAFDRLIFNLRNRYQNALRWVMNYRWPVLGATAGVFAISLSIGSLLGYELFPRMDVGQMRVQVRLEPGTPLEQTEDQVAKMEKMMKDEMGDDLKQLISNIGVFYDLPAAYTPNSGTQDAFIKAQLNPDHETPTQEYVKRLRKRFHKEFPGAEISFYTGGMVRAALNKGKPSPIDVQIKGDNLQTMRKMAERIRDTVRQIRNTRDVRILQRLNQPTKEIDIDRERAAKLGIMPVDAIKNLVAGMNSTASYEKAFWIDEQNGNHYYVGVTYPEHKIEEQTTIGNVVATSEKFDKAIPYRNFSEITRSTSPVEINHHDLTREMNVYANYANTDLGAVSEQVQKRVEAMRGSFPAGYEVNIKGEIQNMQSSFQNLGLGIGLAVMLAYLIIVPLFRSFSQPFIIMFGVPLGFIGVIWMLFLTNTFLSIQSLMGIIMTVGIAVAYGNILIARMNTLLMEEGYSLHEAVIQGSADRFRPVLMTMFTTVFGLLPIAIGIGAGSEANIPLARAVIGGTIAATLLTLFIIPILYSLITKSTNNATDQDQ